LDGETKALSEDVRSRFLGQEQRWHFQRRDGAIPVELMATAAELRQRSGDDAQIVIMVGGSKHWYHHVAGSVGSDIARHGQFPLVVVP
jgi:nucleotide-binding universal stress UspA family protein